MVLDLNQAIKIIKELLYNLKGTSAFSIKINEVKQDPTKYDTYKIDINVKGLGMGSETTRYIITYNEGTKVIENIEEK